jgi:hypothetical protein
MIWALHIPNASAQPVGHVTNIIKFASKVCSSVACPQALNGGIPVFAISQHWPSLLTPAGCSCQAVLLVIAKQAGQLQDVRMPSSTFCLW